MTTVCCPDCGQPVNVPARAREGRCPDCRPQRQHSKPRRDNRSVLDRLQAGASPEDRRWQLIEAHMT